MSISWKLGDPIPETMFEEKSINFEGGCIHYWERGGGPPLYWLHGGPGPNISPVLLELSHTYRVVVLEMPEWGSTSAFDGVNDLHAIGDLWARVIPRITTTPVRLIGSSMGTSVALWLAAVHPGLVSSVVIESPFAIRPVAAEQMPQTMSPEQRAEMARVMRERMPWLTKVPADPAVMLQRVMKFVGPNVDEELFRKMADVSAPVLIIWGQADEMFDPSDGPKFFDAIPDSRLVYVANAGHDVQGARPDAFFDIVSGYLDGSREISTDRTGIVHD